MNEKDLQRTMILNHLESGKGITQLEALREYGVGRLAAVIYDLKHKYEFDIVTEMATVVKASGRTANVARYWLREFYNDG